MVKTEEYFPRGGKKPATTYFKQNENFLGADEKTQRKKTKLKKKSEDDDGYLTDELVPDLDQSYKNSGIYLNYKVVKQGQLFLGRIEQIQETRIQISIPCRMSGIVMACHISEAYNKILEAYVNDQVEKVCELPQMFRVGHYVAVKNLEMGRDRLMLSMMPQHVNSGRMHTDLHKGALLQAAVSSIEDHGYVIDIGIPNTRAFLPKDSANPEIELDIGMLIWVSVKSLTQSATDSVVTLSSELAALQKAVQRNKTATLLPATALEFTVDRPLDSGIEGHVLDDQTAYIQRNHVETVKQKRPALGQKIRARLLYVVPPQNIPFLTMKQIFENTYPDLGEEQKFQNGDIIEEAQVLKIIRRSIHFKLGEGSIGILSVRRMRVHEDLTDEQVLLNSYPIASKHKVRVLCYNLSDYVYSVSDDPKVLAEKYFTMSQLHVGDVVCGTIRAVADNHIRVTVGRLLGYVPQVHISETGVLVDPKKASNSKLPKKKFKEGQAVTARVLAIDLLKKHLILSLKPSLLEPELVVLQSYEQAEVGKAYTGIIAQIKNYLLISFFNNVMAYVPKHLVSAQPPDNLADAFHLGQIVKCTIMIVQPKLKKMHGSLINAPFIPSVRERKRYKYKTDNQECDNVQESANEPDRKKKKIKHKDNAENCEVQETDIDESRDNKKKKHKEAQVVNEISNNIVLHTDEKSRKKEKKDRKINVEQVTDNENITEDNGEKNECEKPKKKKKDKNDKEIYVVKKTTLESEESDAIETDIYEEMDQILTPQELCLVNLSDCLTAKNYKKRAATILKCIQDRTKQVDDINEKISNLENKGLNAKNKKFHTAMHAEKLSIETCTEKLLETLKIVQDKLKILDVSIDEVDHKKKKKQKILADENISGENEEIKTKKRKNGMEHVNEIEVKTLDDGIGDLERKKKKKQKIPVDDNISGENEEIKTKKRKNGMEHVNEIEVKTLDGGIDEVERKKKKKQKIPVDDNISGENEEIETKKRKKEIEHVNEIEISKKLRPAVEVPSAKEFWSLDTDMLADKDKDESSSSEEEEQEKPKKKRKKLTAAEKAAKAREEEERVREMEKRAIESENAPRSSDQFERALLAQPDCSQLWIAYMAFHLQATEIEKARAVARKALNTINFREEAEKLNVWLALLNVEHRFGTKESQQKTLEDALQMNDTYKVHTKLLDILVETSKQQELVTLVELMMKKYRRQAAVYQTCGAALYRAGLIEKARYVMQKGISALEKKEHVALLVRFAQLEKAHGERERCEALFEQVLAVYPQRVDVCAAYLDTLLAARDAERVRQVMERMTSLQLPARKMKVLYRKWIEVEEKIGDETHVERIRQRALQFIDEAKF